MTIPQLIALLENQIATLNNALATADRLGDVSRVVEVQGKIEETQSTLETLKGL